MSEHTPTPWRFEPHGGYGGDIDGDPFPFGYISEDRPGSPIFELSPVLEGSPAVLTANAAMIVRAVNAHDAMLAALKQARVLLNHMGDVLNGMDAVTADDVAMSTPIFEAVKDAIRLAEEGERP